MPNHVSNELEITGPRAELERFRELVKDKDEDGDEIVLSFCKTVPMPDELRGTTSPCPKGQEKIQAEYEKKFGAGNWYDWSCKFWGTKWGAYDSELSQDEDGFLLYSFNTAWSPPAEWIEATSRLFPKLRFKDTWHDEGGPAGFFWMKNGKGHNKELSEHEFLMMTDVDYEGEYECITKGNYAQVIKDYASEGALNYSQLGDTLLERIKPEDLPLFVNFEWDYEETREKFAARMKKGV